MPYHLPSFNLLAWIYRAPLDPFVDSPTVQVLSNLAYSKRVSAPASGGTMELGVVFAAPVLLVPKLTDIQSKEKNGLDSDWVRVPAATGRLYQVAYVEDIGKGFTNEHRAAILIAVPPWPTPFQ